MAQSFGSAYAAARRAGLKAFTWNGKRYHTGQKGESKAKTKAALNSNAVSRYVSSKPKASQKRAPSRTLANGAASAPRKAKNEGGTGVAREGSPLDRAAKTRKALGSVGGNKVGKTVPASKPTTAERKAAVGSPKKVFDRSANRKDPMHRASQDMARRREMEKHTKTGNQQETAREKKRRSRLHQLLGIGK